MELYHGTSLKCAENIKKEGFRIRPSKEHWLGNGIYFYSDYSLAKWWTTKPSKKFGSNGEKAAIIKCSIDESDAKLLNLLNMDGYNLFCNEFEEVFWPKYCERQTINIPTYKQIRCAYCDVLKSMHDYDLIIGNFHVPDQPYRQKKNNFVFKTFNLEYTEIQVCVFNEYMVTIDEIEII